MSVDFSSIKHWVLLLASNSWPPNRLVTPLKQPTLRNPFKLAQNDVQHRQNANMGASKFRNPAFLWLWYLDMQKQNRQQLSNIFESPACRIFLAKFGGRSSMAGKGRLRNESEAGLTERNTKHSCDDFLLCLLFVHLLISVGTQFSSFLSFGVGSASLWGGLQLAKPDPRLFMFTELYFCTLSDLLCRRNPCL